MATFDVKEFLERVSVSKLRSLRKDDLKEVANHLKVEFSPSAKKSEILQVVIKGLDMGEQDMPPGATYNPSDSSRMGDVASSIELAKLELEKEKIRTQNLQLQQELTLRQIELQQVSGRNVVDPSSLQEVDRGQRAPDIAKMANCIPQFHEKDLDSFFGSFERIARNLEWDERYWAMVIQQKLTGKAQAVVAALSDEEANDYHVVKEAVLRAYELIPEAYRQRFRSYRRQSGQTFVELQREKEILFDRWFRSLKIDLSYENLREVVLMEEFKKSAPPEIRTYLEDHKIQEVRSAAVTSDSYELTHKPKSPQSQRKFVNSRDSSNLESHGTGSQNAKQNEGSDRSKADAQKGKLKSPSFKRNADVKCYFCGKNGHLKTDCWQLKEQKEQTPDSHESKSASSGFIRTTAASDDAQRRIDSILEEKVDEKYLEFVSDGEVSFGNSKSVNMVILRDTGSTQTLMIYDEMCLPPESSTGRKVLLHDVNRGVAPVPLYKVKLNCDLIVGEVIVGIVPGLPMTGITFLLGNDVAGGRVVASPIVSKEPVFVEETENLEIEFPGIFPSCVVTRAQAHKAESRKEREENEVSLGETFFGSLNDGDESVSCEESLFSQSTLIKAQEEDEELLKLRESALTVEESVGVSSCFYVKSGILMRKWRPPERPADEEWTIVHQIVVPPPYRTEILRLAHEVPLAGHLGVRKTLSKIMAHFFWPRMRRDVAQFCRTCHTCQMVGKPQHVIKPAPLVPIPAFDEPFSRVVIDCVGPLPKTKSGCQYLLTVMDMSTRFPEAFPLKSITARSVIDALLTFFTRYGLPKEVQSDQGTNFMSNVFQEMMYQLGIQQLKSSAYHPQSQGALERYHQTLKTMMKTYCHDNPNDWDKGIPFLLFATRDVPNESTGFSPFELVFGHEPRGPLKVVKEQLLCDEQEQTNMLDYISAFRERLTRACEVAGEHLRTTQKAMKKRYDKRAKARTFASGDKVLVLMPMQGDALKAKFSGPYVVEKKLKNENYVVSMPDRRKAMRVCHINMLKQYHEREADVAISVVRESLDEREVETPPEVEFKSGMVARVENSKVLANPDLLLGHLSDSERKDVVEILQDFRHVCSDELGCTSEVMHDVEIGDSMPIKQAPYRLHPQKKAKVNKEVEFMLKNGIIEPSKSNWSSPIVLVPKPDGSQRFCIDYRKVNAVTKTDSFPLPRIEDCIDQVGNAAYVSKIDLMKGYWQVPLSQEAREISAFVTPQGLFQCRVMPFGMKNAPATFQRMMNGVVAGHDNCVVYIDDVLVFSNTWKDHLDHLRDLFERLFRAGLVVNLAKCEFGKASVTYLGHEVGQGRVVPRHAKVQAIVDFTPPSTKKELLRFLGMCGFYRKFVPNFSEITLPLTDLLKKGVTFQWSEYCEAAFQKLKTILLSDPVLTAPDFDKSFQLATDASDQGVGAVLLQLDAEGRQKPIAYFSKKLNRYQRNYSTVEKECLSLVLAVQHFEIYLCNGSEITVYTDHNPLTFLR